MKHCIYTKKTFDSSHGEHVLQNFLGARWTSSEIVSNEIQAKFGKTIDVDLETGLQAIRNLLGTKGGRGGIGPTLKNVNSTKGHKLRLHPGGIPEYSEPIVEAQKTSENTGEAQIILGSEEQLGWALKKLKDKFPTAKFNVDEIKKILKPQQKDFNGRVHLNLGLGGIEFFRGLLKSCFNLLGVSKYSLALSENFDSVRNFILHGEGNCSEFIRWAKESVPVKIPSLGKFDHFICVYSEKCSVFGLAQLFGEITYFIRLASNYSGDSFQHSYLVDPTREMSPAEIRNVPFDSSILPKFEKQHKEPGADVRTVYSEKMGRMFNQYYKKADYDMISKIIDEVWQSHSANSSTKDELIGELSLRIAEYAVKRGRKPNN